MINSFSSHSPPRHDYLLIFKMNVCLIRIDRKPDQQIISSPLILILALVSRKCAHVLTSLPSNE